MGSRWKQCLHYDAVLLAKYSRYWHFMLCLGVMGGFSAALIQTAALSCIGHWFKRRRGLATGVDTITPLLLLGNALIKGRLKSKKDTKTRPIISLSIFGDMRFTSLTLSIFGFEIVLFDSLGILPTYTRVNPDYPPNRLLPHFRLEWPLQPRSER